MYGIFDKEKDLFLKAAYCDDIDTVKASLDRGLPVDVADDDYITALQIAAAIGSLELIQLLLCCGADVDKCNDAGFTPFLHACRNGHLNAAKLLLKYGADSRRCTFYGTNAVTLAAAGGYRDIVIYLQGMCDMPQGCAPSPLIAAVAGRHFDLVAFFKLLKNGAFWNVQKGVYETDAYQIADLYCDLEMKDFLSCLDNYLCDIQQRNKQRKKEERSLILPDIRCLIHDRKINQLQCLLESGREYVELPAGVTPIMFAAVVGDLDMIKMLVKKCGNVDASFHGFSALTIAMVCGNDSAVKYLCELERRASNAYGTIRRKDVKKLEG
uniref:ANK_REP_REGION domain-containing protein n=1 Tax=Syphacia muris TaxID=451379 RepID=A0A0N5AZ19_9BILA